MSDNPIVSDLIDNEPSVREDIVSNLQTPNPPGSGEPLNVGTGEPTERMNGSMHAPQSPDFDPTIHEVDEYGQPRLTKDGRFRRKRGAGSRAWKENRGQKPPPMAQSVPNDYIGTASFLADLCFSGAVAAFGPKWQPETIERANIINAGARVMEHYGISDLPPGLALVMAVGAYAVPRIPVDFWVRLGQYVGLISSNSEKKEDTDSNKLEDVVQQPENPNIPQGRTPLHDESIYRFYKKG